MRETLKEVTERFEASVSCSSTIIKALQCALLIAVQFASLSLQTYSELFMIFSISFVSFCFV